MTPQIQYVTKTELYLKVKKPMLERQRRARINKCLDIMKELVAQVQGDDTILRMDKAEMLEAVLTFIKSPNSKMINSLMPGDSFRHGFMNAVNEVSRVMASTPGMNVNVGKAVMTNLGSEFNRLLHMPLKQHNFHKDDNTKLSTNSTPIKYHNGVDKCLGGRTGVRPSHSYTKKATKIWRPW